MCEKSLEGKITHSYSEGRACRALPPESEYKCKELGQGLETNASSLGNEQEELEVRAESELRL